MTGSVPVPAAIRRELARFADTAIESAADRSNLDVVIGMHWFFLHSRRHKEAHPNAKHVGKWKMEAATPEAMYATVRAVLPSVAAGRLPVVKFTNLGNVFSGERLVVAYCFPFGPSPEEGRTLLHDLGLEPYWGSFHFPAPSPGPR